MNTKNKKTKEIKTTENKLKTKTQTKNNTTYIRKQ